MAPSRHDWKIVDWDVKPQHNQPTIYIDHRYFFSIWTYSIRYKYQSSSTGFRYKPWSGTNPYSDRELESIV